jgi:hypothetical protein
MNPLIQLKKATPLFLVALGLVCFGLSPSMQAVVPAPDGGYAGGNTAEGQSALLSLTSGGFNTAIGFLSGRSNTTGNFNTAVGAGTLLANTADDNTATGAGALLSNTTGMQNTAYGAFALASNTTGSFNTADGGSALGRNTMGSSNTAIGEATLFNNTTGISNIALGVGAGSGVTTASGVIAIGANGADVSGSCFIGNIRGVITGNADAIPVLIDSVGQLGTASSSRRYKTDIKPMDKDSESILALKPVSFRYKVHKDTTLQFGLIAEEVAAVNPDLVVRDANGEIYTVRYDAVNAMLLNEFLKEHRTVQELKSTARTQDATISQLKSTAQQQKDFQATVAQQQKQIEALTTGLQKVSAQLEASKPATQVVNNP